MPSGRLRIGYGAVASYSMAADSGTFSQTGLAANLEYSGAAGGEASYDFIDNPTGYTDHWVDPARSTNGDGTQAVPYQWSQMMAFNPAGGRHRFIVLPGQLSVTTQVTSDSKMPVLDPQFSGTADNPVLVKAQYPATRSSTSEAQLTVIRRTASQGSIIGTAGGADYWRFDGFKFEGTHGGAGAENAHIVLRSCTGWWFTRFHIDDEFASYVPHITCQDPPQPGCNDGSTNGGGVFMQLVSNIVLRDFIIENLGQEGGGNLKIWQGVELYDATDLDISHFTLRNIWGIGIHMKGSPDVAFQRNRIHDGVIDNCEDSGMNPFDVEAGADTANHNFWYNIVVKNCNNHAVEFNVILGPHRGTHIQNCTFVNTFGSSVMFRPVKYSADISIRNCVFDNSATHIEWLDAQYPSVVDPGEDLDGDGNGLIVWDYNRYNRFTRIADSSSGSDGTLAAWRARGGITKEQNSDDTTHTYTNAAGGDYTTATSVTANRPDTWNLFGGGNVRPGAFGTIGYRNTV